MSVLEKKHTEIMDKAIEFAVETGIRVIQLAGYDVYYEPSNEVSIKRFSDGMQWGCSARRQGTGYARHGNYGYAVYEFYKQAS